MPLSIAERALLTLYRDAYAQLITGQRVAEVTSNGRTVKYSQADLGRLEQEIARLECADATPQGRRRGAIGFRL